MSERGILFSAPMVRAILAGRKTQTRRVVNLRGYDSAEQFEMAVRYGGLIVHESVAISRDIAWRDGNDVYVRKRREGETLEDVVRACGRVYLLPEQPKFEWPVWPLRLRKEHGDEA